MSEPSDESGAETLQLWDEEAGEIVEVTLLDFDDRLRKLVEALKKLAAMLTKIGNYELKEFDVSIGLKAGFLVVSAEGSITLHYEL